ncbi:Peptide-N4-(N-acetyl-beta-glucosaminyl)asparagine amidase A [Nymphaea thermarum]|nr:Peptide-N4-(N-acetyl-beta-glucosaminyl)asparagine amidase A [Nymphaea thermarum]
MAALCIIFTTILFHLSSSRATAHPLKTRLFTNLIEPPTSPTVFFEVTRPIQTPKEPPCSSLVLQHDFGYTYGLPPVTVPYTPPTHCSSLDWSMVVLEWSAACKGTQYDRIFGVWLSGVEILRSCTAEPRASGIYWKVEKDITRFSSLLKQNQTLSVYLGNLITSVYTGVYHVNLTFHFYPKQDGGKGMGLASKLDSPADLILPISRTPPLNDGYWFLIENSTDVEQKQFSLPRNVYRAVLELYVSFHSDDEFWYANPPNEYVEANNLTDTPGNGAFREVVVRLDERVVGAVCPFTVIYTGGINPLLWRPITGIGSFDLPSYDIEITPFLGEILDKKNHTIKFSVTDALDVWYVDANLHLWLDGRKKKTKGKLMMYDAPPSQVNVLSKFKGLDGVFNTSGHRHISATGWVKSSHGKVTTHTVQRFGYRNWMKFGNDGNAQTVNQAIHSNYGVYFTLPSSNVYSIQLIRTFPLYLYTAAVDQTNTSYKDVTDVFLGFDEYSFRGERFGFSFSSLRNSQAARGYMVVQGSSVTSGLGSTGEVYRYDSTEGCYFRNVSSSNYTILHDYWSYLCSKRSPLGAENVFDGSSRFPFRRASLASYRQPENG